MFFNCSIIEIFLSKIPLFNFLNRNTDTEHLIHDRLRLKHSVSLPSQQRLHVLPPQTLHHTWLPLLDPVHEDVACFVVLLLAQGKEEDDQHLETELSRHQIQWLRPVSVPFDPVWNKHVIVVIEHHLLRFLRFKHIPAFCDHCPIVQSLLLSVKNLR